MTFARGVDEDVHALEEGTADANRRGRVPAADLPATYRRVAGALALARARGHAPADVDRLNDIVVRGHHVLYRRPRPGLRSVLDTATALPRAVRARWRVFVPIAVLFFGLMYGVSFAVQASPDLAIDILGPQMAADYASMYASDDGRPDVRGVDTDIEMFGYYVRNNAGIGLRTLGSGALFGVGSIYTIASNGVTLGAVMGHVRASGHGEALSTFVASHSAIELVAIVLAGGAGTVIGFAFVAPGRRRRRDALARATREMLPVLYGMVAFFLVAAAIEGFWSANPSIPALMKHVFGGAMWVLLALYFGVAARGPAHG